MTPLSDYAKGLILLSQAESLTPRGRRLIDEKMGGPEAVLKDFSPAVKKLVGEKAWQELREALEKGLEALTDAMEKEGVTALTRWEAEFPGRLRDIPDAPELLYVKGVLPQGPALAVVGSRHDTRYGRESAFSLSRDTAKSGVVIVSGMARGIDTAAHRGALAAQGRTVAVLGCGVDVIYPPENRDLAAQIAASGGALVSEYPLGTAPLPYHFPRRNRIISGLSDALLLIEAALKSGTQSTVNHALDQGRTVFALPGNIDAPGSELPLKLLKDGAEICTCAWDIVSRLPAVPALKREEEPGVPAAPPDHPVLKALFYEEKTFEELLSETGLAPADLSSELSLLELDGQVEKRPGRAYALARGD